MTALRNWVIALFGDKKIPYLIAFFVIGFYAVTTRFFGLGQLYHQDEHRWAIAVNLSYALWDVIPHPLLSRIVYLYIGGVTGYDLLRVVPALLSMLTLTLLLVFMTRWYGTMHALVAGIMYTLCAYVLIGSLQIDIDGSFLPLFSLLSIGAYIEWKGTQSPKIKKVALVVLLTSLVLGLLTKLSFVLVPVAILVDASLNNSAIRALLFARRTLLVSAISLGVIGVLAWTFSDMRFISYVKNFIAIGGRDYMQVLFQSAKVIFYSSLLIPFGILLGIRHIRKLSVWYIFLALNLLFYFVVFDFTHRTFDRYLMFIIIPGMVIGGYVFAEIYRNFSKRTALYFKSVTLGVVLLLSYLTHLLFSMPHELVALIPKTQFINSVTSFNWDILFPLSGGSGPIGFYLPLDGMMILVSLTALSGLVMTYLFFSRSNDSVYMAIAMGIVIASTFVQSGFVTYEYLTGGYYGNTSRVATALLMQVTPHDKKILSYNDIGAYELYEKGVYGGRFYPHASYFLPNAEKLLAFKGLYLVVDMPHINKDQLFGTYFGACDAVATSSDKYIEGALLDCDEEARLILRRYIEAQR